MSKHINVNPDHYKVAGRERQGEDVIHEVERREAKRVRQGEVRRPGHGRGVGISNRLPADAEAANAAEHPPLDTSAPPPQDAAGRVSEEPVDDTSGRQTSVKAGTRSTAQKEAGTRHSEEPAPPSRKVSGAFGRERQNND
jgi:hypothetical protein